MSSFKVIRASLKMLVLSGLALLGLSAAPHARADSILLSQMTFVTGLQSTVSSFVAPSAGTITVQLTDWKWPNALSALSFQATTATSVLAPLGTVRNPLEESFEVSAGTYFAHITAQAASGLLDFGLYSLCISFKPSAPTVPLPASGWMLMAGLAVMAAWMARNSLSPLQLARVLARNGVLPARALVPAL